MPTFTVTVTAKVLMVTHVEVEAKDAREAKAKGEAEAREDISGQDWEFPDSGGPDIEDGDIVGASMVTDEAGEVIEE